MEHISLKHSDLEEMVCTFRQAQKLEKLKIDVVSVLVWLRLTNTNDNSVTVKITDWTLALNLQEDQAKRKLPLKIEIFPAPMIHEVVKLLPENFYGNGDKEAEKTTNILFSLKEKGFI